MWILLILFFPVGLFLLWKYTDYSTKTKVIITVVFMALVLGRSSPTNTTTAKQVPTAQSEAVKESSTKKVEQKKEEVQVPQEYKNALKKAELYGNTMHMSKAGIYRQLTSEYGEKFTEKAAQYAISNVNVDYKKQALAKAKLYQKQQAMSQNAVYEQLISENGEQFTKEEAQYAISNLGN